MSTRFYPHPAYAEEQPYARTILTEHVLHRGFSSGAAVGAMAGAVRYGIAASRRRRRHQQQQAPFSSSSSSSSSSPLSAIKSPAAAAAAAAATPSVLLLRSAGTGALVGTALMAGALWQRMRGRDEVEWQDRSWRLLANEGQVLVDDFSVAGAAAAVVLASPALSRGGGIGEAGAGGWRAVVGRAGLGSLLGTVVYMAYRYGVRAW